MTKTEPPISDASLLRRLGRTLTNKQYRLLGGGTEAPALRLYAIANRIESCEHCYKEAGGETDR